MIKAVILVGGPLKGTRFRPLSFDIPKPLFPVAGVPVIQHHIEACVKVKNLKEILIIGFYAAKEMEHFIGEMKYEGVTIKYLQEFTALGTAGGLYHFRDQIRSGNPEAFFVLNGDVCADFPLEELRQTHRSEDLVTIMGTEATRQQSQNFGCMVVDKETREVTHYVEKPDTYVSSLINCGIYIFSLGIFHAIGEAFNRKQDEFYKSPNGTFGRDSGYLQLERDILSHLAGGGRIFALQTTNWWSQLKTASSAIYANRHYLHLYHKTHPERLQVDPERCKIVPDVHIDPTAIVDTSAVIGPNVSIGPGVMVGAGVRIRESIVLDGARIEDRCLVVHSVLGKGSRVGKWARVEGTPCDPDPNKPFAKMDSPRLFNDDGRLNPSITILGCAVSVPSETILLNSIVLPHKELSRSIKNEIIL